MSGAAKAANVETPMTGNCQARPMARAAAMPILNPVNEPGPTVTATRDRREKPPSASAITRAISGSSASAWPRSIAIDSAASGASAPASKTQAEVAASAVSIARIFMAYI